MADNSLRGYVDGLEGAYVTGWAYNGGDGHCEISVRDGNGRILARDLATFEREDLRAVANGRCDVAFRVPLPSLAASESIRVWADDLEITTAPIPLGAGLYDGFVTVGAAHLEGWVAERLPDFVAPVITATDQYGVEVLRCRARKELKPADANFQPARFNGELNDNCFGRGELRLSVHANGAKFAECTVDLPVVSYLEVLTTERCAGWLLSPNAPDREFTIEIFRDGEHIATAKTDLLRLDVQAEYSSCRKPGFDVTLPRLPPESEGAVRLSLRFINSARELFEGPFLTSRRIEIVEAARSLARSSLAAEKSPGAELQRVVLQSALADFLQKARARESMSFGVEREPPPSLRIRMNVIIPVYRGVEETRLCIDSVLASRSLEDRLVIIDDKSPDLAMAPMLQAYRKLDNVFVLSNDENKGFVRTVNRGLAFCARGDVVLLNSDTELFEGALDELWRIGRSSYDIGTVTAISNNATIFSYPYPEHAATSLEDISWAELAREALSCNRGKAIDVPTGHGFCLLIKREILAKLGHLDEVYGRGYGEENDLCSRAADLGYRNVAAAGVLVLHKESVSFVHERKELLRRNMLTLTSRFPEYAEAIRRTERHDDLRSARWALDCARLAKAKESGLRFVLLVCNALGGGTRKAIDEIEKTVGYGGASKLSLQCSSSGILSLTCDSPVMRATFIAGETAQLFKLLDAANISLTIIHQSLGFTQEFLQNLCGWLKGKRSVFYLHDFYPLCPRVTMIDAVHRFCNLAPAEVCSRCVELGGAHEASRLDTIPAQSHRDFFADVLSVADVVITPSENTAAYYGQVFPNIRFVAIPHPSAKSAFADKPRSGSWNEIVLFGAVGPHKGSADLVTLAQHARLSHPHLAFRVIGYTDRDKELEAIGNVTITGAYDEGELPKLIDASNGRLALFLSVWPETFSYTLSEAARFGFIPIVPDLGAPRDRVIAAGYGAIFETPFAPQTVLRLIDEIAQGKRKPAKRHASPLALAPEDSSIQNTGRLYDL